MKCEHLLQIWGVVAGESAFLSKQQFYSAMRLISVAQVCIPSPPAPWQQYSAFRLHQEITPLRAVVP